MPLAFHFLVALSFLLVGSPLPQSTLVTRLVDLSSGDKEATQPHVLLSVRELSHRCLGTGCQ